MRFAPVFATLLFGAPLWAAAGGATTAIDGAGNVWRAGQVDFILTTATAFQKATVSSGLRHPGSFPLRLARLPPFPPPYNVTDLANPQLTFAGVAGTTLWSGAAPGLIESVTQINVRLPAELPAGTSPGAVSVILNAGGALSPPPLISVRQ
jgi:hypothetical protein